MVTVSSATAPDRLSARAAGRSDSPWPSNCQISSARCGVIGAISRASVSKASRSAQASPSDLPASRLQDVRRSCEMRATATLKRKPFQIFGHRRDRLVAGAADLVGLRREPVGHRRAGRRQAPPALRRSAGRRGSDRRQAPSTPASVHCRSRSGGESESMNSAPCRRRSASMIVARGDHVLLRLRHLLDAADRHRLAGRSGRTRRAAFRLATSSGREPVAVLVAGRSRGSPCPG